jgi:hypothetical protein
MPPPLPEDQERAAALLWLQEVTLGGTTPEIHGRLLDEIDGPMLQYGLQGHHGRELMVVPATLRAPRSRALVRSVCALPRGMSSVPGPNSRDSEL